MPVLVNVTTTYLHIPTRADFRPALSDDPDLLVLQAREPLPDFYRFLYRAVGKDYEWTDRNVLTDADLYGLLAKPSLTLLVLYFRGTPVGFMELDREATKPDVEVTYFGIISAFHGRGFGKYLLSAGVQRAYDDGANRVWLHTCTLDGPHALPNYLARGFVAFKQTVSERLVGL
ncbi:MAG TPA: GNAT family N-acetyltransferase [Aggregatilineales bacterium]|nr:GNAT family N-acetyltransferase [Aggregatilineales bacterium]